MRSSDSSPSPALQSECAVPGISLCRIRSGVQSLRSVRFVAARPDKKLASASVSPASLIEHPRAAVRFVGLEQYTHLRISASLAISSADGFAFLECLQQI
jgi:hypothetical protein